MRSKIQNSLVQVYLKVFWELNLYKIKFQNLNNLQFAQNTIH